MTTNDTPTNDAPAGEAAGGVTDAQAAENLWPDAGDGNDSLSGSEADGDNTPPAEEPKPADDGDDKTPEGEEKKPEDGEEPKDKDKDDDGDGEDPKDGDKTEYSDFTIPEELPAEEGDVNWIKDFGKEHKLSQEAAQALIDKHVEMTNRSFDDFNKMKDEWKQDFENDAELGQANFKATCDTANGVVAKYFKEDFTDKLIMFGIGNDKEFARGLVKINEDMTAKDSEISDLKAKIQKLTGEEGIDGSLGAGQESKLDAAKTLYPDMN